MQAGTLKKLAATLSEGAFFMMDSLAGQHRSRVAEVHSAPGVVQRRLGSAGCKFSTCEFEQDRSVLTS